MTGSQGSDVIVRMKTTLLVFALCGTAVAASAAAESAGPRTAAAIGVEGKFRRPAALDANYNVPMQNSLLWV